MPIASPSSSARRPLLTHTTNSPAAGAARRSHLLRKQVSFPQPGAPIPSSPEAGSEMDCPDPNRKRSEVTVACPSDDALVEILSRVPAKARFRSKCVSKSWRDLIADRLLALSGGPVQARW
ncbi:unnamed protein product [Urochloa humidicola]